MFDSRVETIVQSVLVQEKQKWLAESRLAFDNKLALFKLEISAIPQKVYEEESKADILKQILSDESENVI